MTAFAAQYLAVGESTGIDRDKTKCTAERLRWDIAGGECVRGTGDHDFELSSCGGMDCGMGCLRRATGAAGDCDGGGSFEITEPKKELHRAH